MKNMNKTKKIIVAGLVVVVLAGGGIGYKVYADGVHQDKIETAVKEAKTREDNVQKALKEVNANYDATDSNYLKKDLTKESLTPLKKKVSSLSDEQASDTVTDSQGKEVTSSIGELKKSFAKLEEKVQTQTQVNALFQEVAINGNAIQSDVKIKDDLGEKELEVIQSDSLPKNDKWSESVTGFLKLAKEQVAQIKKATASVDSLFTDKQVKADLSKEQLDIATKEIAAIKNEKAKTALTDRLKPATELLAKKEAEEKEKAEAESKQVAEAQASATGGTVVHNADGTYSAQAPAVSETPQAGTNDYQASANAPYQAPSDNGNSNQGATPPASNNGGGASNGGGNQSNGSTGGWSGQGTQTGGGDVANHGDNGGSNGATGGGNTWTGGGFDGSGIDTSGWK